MGKTTDIRELRTRAKDLMMISSYRAQIMGFWKQQKASDEMIAIINRVEALLERVQSSKLPQDTVEVVRIGHQLHACVQEGIKTSKDGSQINLMMKVFIEALGDEDVQGGTHKNEGDDRGVSRT